MEKYLSSQAYRDADPELNQIHDESINLSKLDGPNK